MVTSVSELVLVLSTRINFYITLNIQSVVYLLRPQNKVEGAYPLVVPFYDKDFILHKIQEKVQCSLKKYENLKVFMFLEFNSCLLEIEGCLCYVCDKEIFDLKL